MHPALDTFEHAVRYGPCEATALQERMKRAVALLGEAEVKAILEKEGRIEVCASAPQVTAWPSIFAASLRSMQPGFSSQLLSGQHKAVPKRVGGAQVTCEFCRETYTFQEDEVLAAV